MDLKNSRWASSKSNTYRRPSPARAPPPSTTTSTAPNNTTTQTQRATELARHRRLLRRLRWKLPYLATSHRLATTVDPTHHHYADLAFGADPAAARAEAELMFKLDWFEYYSLLERALLHLLGVFGIVVRAHGNADRSDGAVEGGKELAAVEGGSGGGIIGSKAYAGPFAHRFHANVLASLDAEGNPLHAVLGAGEVRMYLGQAKDLRNRWKDADERAAERAGVEVVVGSVSEGRRREWEDRDVPPLSSFDMERMLRSIFEGFERALSVAENAVHDGKMDTEDNNSPTGGGDEDGDMMMEDAMDWQN